MAGYLKRFIKAIDLIVDLGEKIQVKLGAFMLIVIVASIFLGVIMRYVFSLPLLWPEEVSGLLFVWVCFFGAGAACSRKQHIIVDILSDKFDKPWKHSIIYFLILIFLGTLVLGGIGLQGRTGMHTSGALGIPRSYYYLALLIVSIYMFIFYLGELMKTIVSIKENKEDIA